MLQIVITLKKYYKNQLPKNPQKILSIFARGEERVVNPLASEDGEKMLSSPAVGRLEISLYS